MAERRETSSRRVLRKMVSLRRQGGSGGPVGPILPFSPNRAPDVPVRHARRRASIAWRLRGYLRFARRRWRRPACPQSPPSQRDRSRRHKPPNGAPEGVTLNYSKRGTTGAPSDQPMTPRLAKPGRDGSHENRFFEKRSRATGAAFLLPRREKKQNQHLSFS